MIDYTKRKNWNSLTQLKSKIEADKKEKVIQFLGHTLITNKFRYTLYNGELTRTKA